MKQGLARMKTENRETAQCAVRALISWIGDDPDRVGLHKTPARVAEFFQEFFVGYKWDPLKILTPLPEKPESPSQMVLLKNIEFSSYCEHHIAPMVGKMHIAYVPDEKLVGLSKIVKCVRAVTGKLQLQERICSDMVKIMDQALQPKGTAAVVVATHHCMIAHREKKASNLEVETIVSEKSGIFETNDDLYSQFIAQLNLSR